MPETRQVQRVDPVVRRRLILVLLVAATAGAGLVLWLERWLQGFQGRLPDDPVPPTEQIEWLLAGFSLLSTLPLLIGAVFVWRYGSAIVAADRFPPPGSSVVRDTPIVTGNAARRRGFLLRVFALTLAGFAVAVPLAVGFALVTLRAGVSG